MKKKRDAKGFGWYKCCPILVEKDRERVRDKKQARKQRALMQIDQNRPFWVIDIIVEILGVSYIYI
jgi:predicted transcriptional regulator